MNQSSLQTQAKSGRNEGESHRHPSLLYQAACHGHCAAPLSSPPTPAQLVRRPVPATEPPRKKPPGRRLGPGRRALGGAMFLHHKAEPLCQQESHHHDNSPPTIKTRSPERALIPGRTDDSLPRRRVPALPGLWASLTFFPGTSQPPQEGSSKNEVKVKPRIQVPSFLDGPRPRQSGVVVKAAASFLVGILALQLTE